MQIFLASSDKKTAALKKDVYLYSGKYLDTINNTFYDWFFIHHTSLKILVIALAMPPFLASFGKKITAVKNESYLCPSTYIRTFKRLIIPSLLIFLHSQLNKTNKIVKF